MTQPAGRQLTSRSSRRRRLAGGLAATVLGVALSTTNLLPAQAAPAYFCPDSTQPYATVAEVEALSAGTAVTGLSVTKGTTPDEFTGTYVGFIDNALGKDKDLLLFRLSSPVIDGTPTGLKGAGIWAGMSGSPVYTTDGRLIGAVSYKLTAENLPIAGVTPAEYMKTIGTTALTRTARVQVTSTNLKAKADASTAGTDLVGSTFAPVRTVNVAGTAGAKPNAFANRTLARTPRSARAASFLRSGTFLPAAAQAAAGIPASLVAGGTIAVTYTSGDLISGAVGTVTAVCGNTVWAFGHPMANAGKAKLLMANASTAMIVPDGTGLVGSYKQVSEFGSPVGMITEDRTAGIRGTLGGVTTFAISVNVLNASGSKVAGYAANISDPEVAGSAVAALVGQAAYEQLDQYGAGTGQVTWTIKYRRQNGSTGSLTNSQIVTDEDWFPDLIGTPAADDVSSIVNNPFENVTITGIGVTLKLLDDDAVTYKIARVQVASKGSWTSLAGKKLKAGSTYSIRPQYLVRKNGKASGAVAGKSIRVALSGKARKSGTFQIAPANTAAEPCQTLPDGSIVCEDWAVPVEEAYADFDELIAALDELQSDSLVLGELQYRLRKGSSSRAYRWTGPGVVDGSATAAFSIRS